MSKYKHHEELLKHLRERIAESFTQDGGYAGFTRTYSQEGGKQSHPLRAVGYQLKEGGPMVPLIDGKTGGVVAFPKDAMNLAMYYDYPNEARHVLSAMEEFDAIKTVAAV